MTIKTLFTGSLIMILLLAGCAPATATLPAPEPTLDEAAVVAAAVRTISAQMTEEALRNPSPTPQPTATHTPQPPTATPLPPTATPEPFTPTPAEPTATNTPLPLALSAQALFPVTYPENKRGYLPNETFGLALGFKNTGTLAWDENYTLQMVSFTGEATVQIENIRLGYAVEPGKVGEFNLWAFGSETITTHTWNFQMYNSAGVPVPGGFTSFTYTSITD